MKSFFLFYFIYLLMILFIFIFYFVLCRCSFLYVCFCEGEISSGTEVIGSCELPCGCWELNPGCSLEEYSMLLTTPVSILCCLSNYAFHILLETIVFGWVNTLTQLKNTLNGFLFWLVFCQLDTNQNSLLGRTSIEELLPLDWQLWEHFLY